MAQLQRLFFSWRTSSQGLLTARRSTFSEVRAQPGQRSDPSGPNRYWDNRYLMFASLTMR